jgi:hypothetical protein
MQPGSHGSPTVTSQIDLFSVGLLKMKPKYAQSQGLSIFPHAMLHALFTYHCMILSILVHSSWWGRALGKCNKGAQWTGPVWEKGGGGGAKAGPLRAYLVAHSRRHGKYLPLTHWTSLSKLIWRIPFPRPRCLCSKKVITQIYYPCYIWHGVVCGA